jgi:hypothetical protein
MKKRRMLKGRGLNLRCGEGFIDDIGIGAKCVSKVSGVISCQETLGACRTYLSGLE